MQAPKQVSPGGSYLDQEPDSAAIVIFPFFIYLYRNQCGNLPNHPRKKSQLYVLFIHIAPDECCYTKHNVVQNINLNDKPSSSLGESMLDIYILIHS